MKKLNLDCGITSSCDATFTSEDFNKLEDDYEKLQEQSFWTGIFIYVMIFFILCLLALTIKGYPCWSLMFK